MLCEIFIIRSTFRLITNIITPFLECETRDKARSYINRLRRQKAISPDLYKMIFKKGLINNLTRKYRSYLVPEDEGELKRTARI
jgi:hypothetical protein